MSKFLDRNYDKSLIVVNLEQLSPKLKATVTEQPEWILHFSLTETLVEKSEFVYHYPTISYEHWEWGSREVAQSEFGFINVITTKDSFLVAELPLRVKWMFIGITSGEAYLAFNPMLVSADEQSVLTSGNNSGYFRRMENVLGEILSLPYLVRPNGEQILRVPDIIGEQPDRFMLVSEAQQIYNQNTSNPDVSVVATLMKWSKYNR